MGAEGNGFTEKCEDPFVKIVVNIPSMIKVLGSSFFIGSVGYIM